MRTATAALVALCALTFLAGLGGPAISDSDEAYYAEAGREMIESGDWLTPHYNYTARFEKPILFYWIVATAYLVGGVNEYTARVGSALAAVGLVLVTAWWSRRTYDATTGLLAGAIVATSFGCIALARMSLPDMTLALLVTAAIAAGLVALADRQVRLTRWAAVAACCAALSLLAKGPIGVVLAVGVLLPAALTARRWRRVPVRALLVAVLIFGLVAAPWYVLMTREHGVAYLQGFFIGDNLERFATTRFNPPRPIWFYVPALLGGMLPWSPFLMLAASPVANMFRSRLRLHEPDWLVVTWAVVPFAIFSASVGKQERYVLPMLAPLAILTARLILTHSRAVPPSVRSRAPVLLRAAAVASGLVLAAGGALIWRAGAALLETAQVRLPVVMAAVIAAGLGIAALGASRHWRAVPAALAVATALGVAGTQMTLLARAGPAPVEQAAALIAAHRHAGERVATYRVFVRNLIFYSHLQREDLDTTAEACAFLESPDRVLCIMREQDLDELARASRVPPRRLARLTALDLLTLKPRALIQPDRARDVQAAVIVTNR